MPLGMEASTITFDGTRFSVVDIKPGKETGLDAVYVLHDLNGVSVAYESTDVDNVKWYKFSNLGGAYSEPLTDVITADNRSILNNPAGSYGYMIKDGNKTVSFWLIDYSDFILQIDSLSPSAVQDCNSSVLEFMGNGKAIPYFSINGKRDVVSRDIILEYNTLEFDNNLKQFVQTKMTKLLPFVDTEIAAVPPALCPTKFRLTGDRFLREWGDEITIESEYSDPSSISVFTEVLSDDKKEDSNVVPTGNLALGGSAPATIRFLAYVSDAVDHMEWQISKDENFSDLTHRIFQQDFEYTFMDEGSHYVRFVAYNGSGSCDFIGETYSINIGESILDIPNIFSPNNDGINDEWKVSYRSLSSFECHIFDRNGHEVFYSKDPEQGWDGKGKGNRVKSGVYFYVIDAIGTDGKRYKKSGDINILDYRESN